MMQSGIVKNESIKMTIKIEKQRAVKGLIGIVEKMSDVDLSVCYQCKKCTSGCPVARFTQSPSDSVRSKSHMTDTSRQCHSLGVHYRRPVAIA